MARKTPKTAKTKAGKLPDDIGFIWQVLRATNGKIKDAATRLGVEHYQLHYWLDQENRRDELYRIRYQYEDNILDEAVSALEKNLKSVDGRIRNTAIQTAFKYFGKRRGYIPANYVENETHGDIEIKVIRG
jgi:hypothetical protein